MIKIQKADKLCGSLRIPGDKSISHRSIMLGAIAEGISYVRGFLPSADCLATIACFRKMGIEIREVPADLKLFPDAAPEEMMIRIEGKGLRGLASPDPSVPLPLDAMNSGTTVRLISGICANQAFPVLLDGDESLRKRPMSRILTPLTLMGISALAEGENGRLPLLIHGGKPRAVRYESPVASAQVKSCVLLAGLGADGPVTVSEPFLSRDHTERMLTAFGARLEYNDTYREALAGDRDASAGERPEVTVYPVKTLYAQTIHVPGDISSAAWFIAAALLAEEADVTLQHVGINPTRDGILRVCRMMGAEIELRNRKTEGGEEVADLRLHASKLYGTEIGGALIPTLIDEIPVIAVMAAAAEGETLIRDAAELKVKESNRLFEIISNLRCMGVCVEELDDGMRITGLGSAKKLRGCTIDPKGDHRLAMAFSVAGLFAEGETAITDEGCVAVSYPSFYRDLAGLVE